MVLLHFVGLYFMFLIVSLFSAMMGLVLPSILPREYTHVFGGLLFCYFGIKLVYDARQLEANKVSDELEEVEEELTGKKSKKREEGDSDDGSADVENGEGSEGSSGASNGAGGYKRSQSGFGQASGFRGQSFGTVVGQSFLMSFLAEWGDRSQIATIALAAAKDPLGVVVGGCLGHSMCTGMAVIGGRMLASKISERTVSLFGGIIFCIFGIHSLFFET
jgi:putative Ca2+/H+ antiporter (TMEM165/GDT1 family)